MPKDSCVAIGTFDGVHRGHRGLIDTLIKTAREKKLRSVIVALSKPVRRVSGLITDYAEKKALLERFPVDEVIILPVVEKLSKLSAMEFVKKYLIAGLKAKHLVVGSNFAFGHGREGNIHWLKKHRADFRAGITIKDFLCSHGKVISSTRIRSLLHEGRVEFAAKLLGRIYSFEGTPVKGRGLASKMGFHTINLKVKNDKVLPRGIFIAFASGKKKFFPAIINIGSRPTFFKSGEIVPEVNLIGFKGRWGKAALRVFLLKHLRKEKKFSSVAALSRQIGLDLDKARRFFGFTF